MPQYLYDIGSALSQAWLPFRVSPIRTAPRSNARQANLRHCCCALLPRFLPLRRFPSHGEPPNPNVSHDAGCVAPSGFRTLSTPCSPHDLPSLFHPGPVLGVNPSRFSSLTRAVRSLNRRGLPDVQRATRKQLAPPTRHDTRPRSRMHRRGLANGPPDTSLGFLLFEASCSNGFLRSLAVTPLSRFSNIAAS
jgi:hypothetical protein